MKQEEKTAILKWSEQNLKRKALTVQREKKKKPKIITIEQVARYQMKHREETGEWLSYTDCCKILEEKRNETN